MKVRLHHFAVAASMTGLFSSCEDDQAKAKLEKLEVEVATLRSTFLTESERNKAAVDGLRNGVLDLYQRPYTEKRVALNLTTHAFCYVECDAGRLGLMCVGAEPYLDGHKITLSIGNPFTAQFTGFKVKARFGPRPPAFPVMNAGNGTDGSAELSSYQAKHNAWEKALKTQEASFTQPLTPGAWTKAELILSPSKAEEVGYVDVEIETDSLSLNKAIP